jgi:hypothetical protein
MTLGLVGLAIWWVGAGFLSVYVYRRTTGQLLSVDSGIRMGWITGLLGSTIMAVIGTVAVVLFVKGGEIANVYNEQLRKTYGDDPKMQQALSLMQKDPTSFAFGLVLALMLFLLLFAFLCTAGGALGAKMVGGVTGPRA